MRTVYKYPINSIGTTTHERARFVHGGKDPQGELCVWLEIETNEPTVPVLFKVIGTGHEVPKGAQHLFSYTDAQFVWHVYAAWPL